MTTNKFDVPKQDVRLGVKVWHDTRPEVLDAGVTYIHCAQCLD